MPIRGNVPIHRSGVTLVSFGFFTGGTVANQFAENGLRVRHNAPENGTHSGKVGRLAGGFVPGTVYTLRVINEGYNSIDY